MELKVPTLSERQIIRKIPYAFAKAKGVLLSNVSSERADVHIRKGATVATLAEVRRILGVPLHATLLSLEDFEKALTISYAQSDGSAA